MTVSKRIRRAMAHRMPLQPPRTRRVYRALFNGVGWALTTVSAIALLVFTGLLPPGADTAVIATLIAVAVFVVVASVTYLDPRWETPPFFD